MAVQCYSRQALIEVQKRLQDGDPPAAVRAWLRLSGIEDPERYIRLAGVSGTMQYGRSVDLLNHTSRQFKRYERDQGERSFLAWVKGVFRALVR
jgi:hypothetical protein